jgi:hypothetical protein
MGARRRLIPATCGGLLRLKRTRNNGKLPFVRGLTEGFRDLDQHMELLP